jgi:hypothetical protein
VLSYCRSVRGLWGTQFGRPRGLPLANLDPSALMVAREGALKI